jgi:hypothetical protein
MSGEISIESAAIKYADRGLYVFPVNGRTKRPMTEHGNLDASADPLVVAEMFRQRSPGAVGIGVNMGPSGLVLFDADSAEAEAALRERVGDAALSVGGVVLTSRGRHYYYRAPEGVLLNGVERLCGIENLDVRSGSSYGILPPSPHPSGAVYRFADYGTAEGVARFLDDLAPCPALLVEMLLEHAQRHSNPAEGLRDSDGRTRLPKGTRNGVIWRAAAEARRFGADVEAVTSLAETMSNHQCGEPLPKNEIAGIVKSVMRNVKMDRAAVLPVDMFLTAEELEETAPAPPRVEKLRRLDVAYMAANEPPEVDWVAPGLVAREAVTMIHGAAGLGKSMLALALAVAVTRGAPFMNYSTMLGRTLYVDAENGQGEAHRRIRALNLTPSEAERLAYFEAVSLDLVKDEEELRAAAVAAEPDLIVIDSLATVNRNDEDSSREMTPTLQVLQRLARATSAGVVVLHHDKKDRTTLRGSTAIEAVVEIRWHLTKDEDREGARRLTNEKCRLAAESPERWVEIRQTPAGIEVTQVAKPPTTKEADLWSDVMNLLSDGEPRTNRGIAEGIGYAMESGGAPGNLSRLLKEKREAGYLVGSATGGVTLAPHLLSEAAVRAEQNDPARHPAMPDPLIPLYREGSEDRRGEAA